jgi:hypothetical protein
MYPLGARPTVFTARHFVGWQLWLALQDRSEGDTSAVSRLGRYVFLTWLYTICVCMSVAAWVLRGRRPRCSEQRFVLGRRATVTLRSWK